MKKSTVCCLIAVLILGSPAFAQQQGSEMTIEQLYLQNAEIRIIREQAITQDRDMKLMALENIQTMLDEGKLAPGAREAHLILEFLSGEGSFHQVRENMRLVNDFPDVRRRAVNLLGQLGGSQATDTLLLVLRQDAEPMVMAEAAYALGKLGTNDANRTSQTLAGVLLAQDAIGPDNNFAYASLLAFDMLAEANNGLEDSAAIEALIRVIQGNYIRVVKQKAFEVLDKIRNNSGR